MSSSSDPLEELSPAARRLVQAPARLRALRRYNLPRPAPDENLQRIADLAAALLDAPLAVIAFADDSHLWIEASVGVDRETASLDPAFFARVLGASSAIVAERAVPNAPAASGDAASGPMRFRAGAPLVASDGHPLGALCVMDTTPHTVPASLLERLETLAQMAIDELELQLHMQAEARVRQQLHEEKTRLRGLTDAIPGVVYQFYARADGSRGLYIVSQRATDILGLAPDTDDFFERFVARLPGDHSQRFLKSVDAAVERQEKWDLEMPFEHPDGSMRWLHGRSAPEVHDDPAVHDDKVVYNGVLFDITERVESQQRFRQFAEQTNDLISLHGADSSYLYASPAARDLLGYAPSDLLGRSAFDFIHPDDHDHVREQQAQALDGSDVRFDYRLLRADGTPLWVETSGGMIKAETGALKLLAATRSIHERKRAEKALEESRRALEQERQWLETAVLGGDLGLWECNYNTGRNTVTERWASMLGYALEDVEPTLEFFQHLVHPDDFPGQLRALDEYVEQGLPYMESEARMRTASGSWRWILSRGRVVEWNEDGTPRRAVGTHMDITDRKRYETELIEAKDRAEEASRLKSAVVANMSHEVRTPLTGIIGFAEILEEKAHDEQQKHFAHLVQQSSKRLLHTLNSVLHLSRLEAGRQTLELASVDAAAIAREVVDAHRSQAARKGVDLALQAPPSCPLSSDADVLSRILSNLVGNAIKFTDAGGRVTVRVAQPTSVESASAAVRFDIVDTGIGISAAFQARMFEAFEQESSGTNRRHEGSGLGLTIVKRLVDLVGGTIEVDSRKGEGTRFRVVVPAP